MKGWDRREYDTASVWENGSRAEKTVAVQMLILVAAAIIGLVYLVVWVMI